MQFVQYDTVQNRKPPVADIVNSDYNTYTVNTKLTYAGNYTLISWFFEQWKNYYGGTASKYYLFMKPGFPRGPQSYSKVDYTNIPADGLTAGDLSTFIIQMKDQYANIIPASTYASPNDTLPALILTAPVSTSPAVSNQQSVFEIEPSLRKIDSTDKKIIYTYQVVRAGANFFRPLLNKQDATCTVCYVPVKYNEAVWDNSDFYLMKDGIEVFIKDKTNGPQVNNIKEYPIFYVRQKDLYNNVLPTLEAGWSDFKASLIDGAGETKATFIGSLYRAGIKFQLTDSYYIEVDRYGKPSVDNDRYRLIPYGNYTLKFVGKKTFTNGTADKTFTTTMTLLFLGEGADVDKLYSSQPIDPAIAKIEPEVLTIIAGEISQPFKLTLYTTEKKVINGISTDLIAKFRYRDVETNGIKLIAPEGAPLSAKLIANAGKPGFFSLTVSKELKGTFEYTIQVNPFINDLGTKALDSEYKTLNVKLKLIVRPAKLEYLVLNNPDVTGKLTVQYASVDFPAFGNLVGYDRFTNIVEDDTPESLAITVIRDKKILSPLPQYSVNKFANFTYGLAISNQRTGNYIITSSYGFRMEVNGIFALSLKAVFLHGKPSPQRSIAYVNDTEIDADQSIDFIVKLRDQYDNPIFFTPNRFFDPIEIVPKTDLYIKFVNTTVNVSSGGEFQLFALSEKKISADFATVTFTKSIQIAGTCVIAVNVDGILITGKPGNVLVNPLGPIFANTEFEILDNKLLENKQEVFVKMRGDVASEFSTGYSPKIRIVVNDKFFNRLNIWPSDWTGFRMYIENNEKISGNEGKVISGTEKLVLCRSTTNVKEWGMCSNAKDQPVAGLPARRWIFFPSGDFYRIVIEHPQVNKFQPLKLISK